MKSKLFAFLVGIGLAVPVLAAVFNQFGPVTGVLKGNASSPITTAAISSDIIAMWTGTCNASSALLGNGACGTLASGTVTSVGLTMPTGFSVTGSPVTTSGTLAVSTTLNGPVRGNGTGLITGNTSLTTEVTGLLPVANGGSGIGTLTGVLHGNGTSPFTAANVSLTAEVTGILPVANGGTNLSASADDNIMVGNGTTWQTKTVPACTDTGGNHLNYDASTNTVSCGTSSSTVSPVGANPTASVGLTAVNGAATTFLRSDGAPALSQAIAPTWSSQHIFTGAVSSVGTTGVLPGSRSSLADIWFVRSGAAADNRVWEQINLSAPERMSFRALNDAASANANWLEVTRGSGAAISDLSFGNATNNPTYNFLGTGTATYGGDITMTRSASGATSTMLVQNTSNTASSGARLTASVAGSSAGDPDVRLNIAGANDWFMRVENATSDQFALIANSTKALTCQTTGACDFPVSLTVAGSPISSGTSGTFTATLSTGCTTTPSTTGRWAKVGSIVVINYGSITCTSNSTQKAFDASVPAAERPAASVAMAAVMAGDNGTKTVACPRLSTAGVLDVDSGGATGGACAGASWTASGTFSLPGFSISYQTAN